MNATHSTVTPPRSRPGFTLVELLVALLLLDCALLALVGTGALMTRWLGGAANAARAGAAATARLERLASLSCNAATSGAAVDARGMREWWVAQVDGDGTRLLADSVEYPFTAGTRRIAGAATRTLC